MNLVFFASVFALICSTLGVGLGCKTNAECGDGVCNTVAGECLCNNPFVDPETNCVVRFGDETSKYPGWIAGFTFYRVFFAVVLGALTGLAIFLLVRTIRITWQKQRVKSVKAIMTDLNIWIVVSLIGQCFFACIAFAIDPHGYFKVLGNNGWTGFSLTAVFFILMTAYSSLLYWYELIRTVKNLDREFKIRTRIKVILLIIAILAIISIILVNSITPLLAGLASYVPGVPLILMGLGLVFLVPLVTFQYFQIIRKSKQAAVSPQFRQYIRRIGFGILGFFCSGLFTAICFGWGGATLDGNQRLISTFFFYLGFIGIFASFFAVMWKDTPPKQEDQTATPNKTSFTSPSAPASGPSSGGNESSIGRSSVEMERKESTKAVIEEKEEQNQENGEVEIHLEKSDGDDKKEEV